MYDDLKLKPYDRDPLIPYVKVYYFKLWLLPISFAVGIVVGYFIK